MELELELREEANTIDAILASIFGVFVIANVGAVFLLPDVLGYPRGGSFLLTALPAFGFGATVLAIATGAFAVIRKHKMWAPALVSLGFLALAVANAFLWIAAAASV